MRIALVLAALAMIGCTPHIPDGAFACMTTLDCPPGQSCNAGVCRVGAFDGGPPFDAGIDAAMAPDSGPDVGPDVGTDAAPVDGGPDADLFVVHGEVAWHRDDATDTRPVDFAALPLEVYTLSGTTLSAPVFPTVMGTSDRGLVVPRAPVYYVHTAPTQYVVTDARSLDIGTHRLGRPNTAVSADATTTVRFDLTGLDPWQAGDVIEVMVTNADVYHYLSDDLTMPPPPTLGATSLSMYVVPWINAALVSGDMGDRLRVFHTSSTTLTGGHHARVVVDQYASPAFNQTHGSMLTRSGALLPVPASTTADIDWRATQFEALRSQAGPDQFSGTLDLLVVETDGTSDVALTGVSYGNPFDPTDLLRGVGVNFPTTYQTPSLAPATFTVFNTARVGRVDEVSASLSSMMVPLVAPPTSIRVGGVPLDDIATYPDVSLATPTVISFAPGATLATPTRYFVRVFELVDRGDGVTSRVLAATFDVRTGTSVVVPAGLLAPSRYYYVFVEARVEPGPGLLPRSFAAATSSVFHTTP